MSRLILLVVAVTVVYLLFRSYRRGMVGGKPQEKPQTPPRAEDMVRCAYCGVHLPVSESILAGKNYYCSDAHRRAHQDAAGGDGG